MFSERASTYEFTSGQPELTSGDFPSAAPCSDRDTLPKDETFLSIVTNATEVIHIYNEYSDDTKLPAVCGLTAEDNTLTDGEISWDPSFGVNMYACNSFDESLSAFLTSTGYVPGICRSAFGYSKIDNSTEGFPRGGIYRVDACISDGGESSYNVRFRIIITGKDVNKTWTKAGIEDTTSLEIFNSSGLKLSTTEETKKLITEHPGGTIFTIRSGGGVNTHLSVVIQVICVTSTEFCPIADYVCD
jgi:hypothetical protein